MVETAGETVDNALPSRAPVAPAGANAFRAVLERWFGPCVDIAFHVLHDLDAAAEVARDTLYSAWQANALRDPSAAVGKRLLRSARDTALGRLAQHRHTATLADPWPPPATGGAPDRPDDGAGLAQAASAALGESDASVLHLHLRHGFGTDEIGEALGASKHDAQELLLRLKRRLGRALRAWALWEGGRGTHGTCPDLHAALEGRRVRAFGPEAVTVVASHSRQCARCQEHQRLAGSPEALFAAVPIVTGGPGLIARAAGALTARGVPLGGPADGPGVPAPGALASGAGPAAGAGARGSAARARSADDIPPPGGAEYGDGEAGHAGTHGAHLRRRAAGAGLPGRAWLVGAGIVAVLVLGGAAALSSGGSGSADGDPTTDLTTDRSSASSAPGATTTTTPPPVGAGPAPGGTATPTVPPTGRADLPPATIGPAAGAPTDPPPNGTTPGTAAPPSTATQPPAPPPTIAGFGVVDQSLGSPCAADQLRIAVGWETTGTDATQLAGLGAPGGTFPSNGMAIICRDAGPPRAYTLTATGPGGTVTSTITA